MMGDRIAVDIRSRQSPGVLSGSALTQVLDGLGQQVLAHRSHRAPASVSAGEVSLKEAGAGGVVRWQ